MKKYVILLTIVLVIIGIITYLYYQAKVIQTDILSNNKDYIVLLDKEISGTELATLINKTINKNEKNNVSKDENGVYQNNNKNSISIQIKFKENDNIIDEEKIQKNDISKFILYYASVNFKCTKVEYHEKTKLIKYLYFEEQ